MKAAIIEDIKKFKITDVEKPTPDNERVIIDVLKTGICGSDIHNWDAGQPKGLIMGHEFTGKVVHPGSRIDLKIGDRVTALPISPCGHCEACETGNPQYCPETWTHAVGLDLDNPGGLTSTISVRPDMVIKLPDNISDEEGAMVEPTAVGLHAVHLADIRVGDKVLVVGGGIIGLVSAMFAKLEGAEFVAISETNPARGEKSVKLGVADEWFDAKDEKFLTNILTEVPSGFDVVIDCIDDVKAKVALAEYCQKKNIPFLMCLGMGNRIDPSQVELTTLDKTSTCPLARKMRSEVRKRGLDLSRVTVAFSQEPPLCSGPVPASIMTVPSAAGLTLAYGAMKILLSKKY